MTRNLGFTVAARARADIKDILLYTLQTWGENQMLAYSSTISFALERIKETPFTGRVRGGLFLYPVAQHSIYYRVMPTTIFVLRVLHARMDAVKHLPL